MIQQYQDEKNDKLLKQFELLKPRPYQSIISIFGVCITLLIFQYFANFDIFSGDNLLIVMFVIVISGYEVVERIKINNRIDMLVLLLKSNAFYQDDK